MDCCGSMEKSPELFEVGDLVVNYNALYVVEDIQFTHLHFSSYTVKTLKLDSRTNVGKHVLSKLMIEDLYLDNISWDARPVQSIDISDKPTSHGVLSEDQTDELAEARLSTNSEK